MYEPKNDDLLQLTTFTLSQTKQSHSREVYNFTELFGEIGGLYEIFTLAFAFLLSNLPEQSFILSLMNKFERDKKAKVSLCQKVKLLFYSNCKRCSRFKDSQTMELISKYSRYKDAFESYSQIEKVILDAGRFKKLLKETKDKRQIRKLNS